MAENKTYELLDTINEHNIRPMMKMIDNQQRQLDRIENSLTHLTGLIMNLRNNS